MQVGFDALASNINSDQNYFLGMTAKGQGSGTSSGYAIGKF